jgi:hypothetical protein
MNQTNIIIRQKYLTISHKDDKHNLHVYELDYAKILRSNL